MIESRQNTDFRTVFRIFIRCLNSLFFVPNFQPKFWQGNQIYLTTPTQGKHEVRFPRQTYGVNNLTLLGKFRVKEFYD